MFEITNYNICDFPILTIFERNRNCKIEVKNSGVWFYSLNFNGCQFYNKQHQIISAFYAFIVNCDIMEDFFQILGYLNKLLVE